LRGTDAYKKRFAANAARIAKGLGALSEAEYIGLEDQYQNIMRNYGLPQSTTPEVRWVVKKALKSFSSMMYLQ
jgi:hypothetical protein